MHASWRSIFIAVVLGTSSTAVCISACSGGERPTVGEDLPDPDGSTRRETGTSDAEREAEASVTPNTCTNTVKDGNETDTDCGGNQCAKCIDKKTCIAKTDCAGGACLAGKCATPACTNKATDGDESDTDCGGTICAKCTTGKKCLQGSDCLSGACANNVCRCPQGMIEVSRAGGGGAYCIDETEVTKFKYNKFITANVKVDDQEAVCKPPVNTSFFPRGAFVPAVAPPYFQQAGLGLNFNSSLPVHYVDWCDAYAYCKWAGKQLCGSVTGGTVAFDKANQAADGAWFNACSAQGNLTYPYGNTFFPKCNGGVDPDAGATANCGPQLQQRSGFGCAENQDEGVHEVVNGDLSGNYNLILFGNCQGGVTGLYHMVGNVAEWEDSCDGTLPESKCRVRGGSYLSGNDGTGLRCAVERTEQRVPPTTEEGAAALADVGFRCCLY